MTVGHSAIMNIRPGRCNLISNEPADVERTELPLYSGQQHLDRDGNQDHAHQSLDGDQSLGTQHPAQRAGA